MPEAVAMQRAPPSSAARRSSKARRLGGIFKNVAGGGEDRLGVLALVRAMLPRAHRARIEGPVVIVVGHTRSLSLTRTTQREDAKAQRAAESVEKIPNPSLRPGAFALSFSAGRSAVKTKKAANAAGSEVISL